jgi:uncharacterized integral membrane protein (TIGR00697 family)
MDRINLIKKIWDLSKSYNKLTIKGFSQDDENNLLVSIGVNGKKAVNRTCNLDEVHNYIDDMLPKAAFQIGALSSSQGNNINEKLLELGIKCNSKRFFILLSSIFITLIFSAEIMGTRLVSIPIFSTLIIPSGLIIFPLAFVLLDIIVEVYGYSISRRLIWSSIFCQFIFSILCYIAMALPSIDTTGSTDIAFQRVLGSDFSLSIAVLIAFTCGCFVNSYIMEKTLFFFGNQYIWLRSVLTTIISDTIYTLLWYPIVFHNINFKNIAGILVIKILYQMIFLLPINSIVSLLKRHETYTKVKTNSYNPFMWTLD